jgi:hypothetical protein
MLAEPFDFDDAGRVEEPRIQPPLAFNPGMKFQEMLSGGHAAPDHFYSSVFVEDSEMEENGYTYTSDKFYYKYIEPVLKNMASHIDETYDGWKPVFHPIDVVGGVGAQVHVFAPVPIRMTQSYHINYLPPTGRPGMLFTFDLLVSAKPIRS